MIVSLSEFDDVVKKLSQTGTYAVDTETTGVYWAKNDRLFSIIISDGTQEYYFNFNDWDDIPLEYRLPRESISLMSPIFSNPASKWFGHNFKFDLHMLSKEGLEIAGEVHCTMAIERVKYNAYFGNKPYSLDKCAERMGFKKDDAVKKHCDKNKLYRYEATPGKKQQRKIYYFNMVPFDIIVPYGLQDAKITHALGMFQIAEIKRIAGSLPTNFPSTLQVLENEKKLTKTCYKIEKTGVKIDREFCRRAIEFEEKRRDVALASFRAITGLELIDSNKFLEGIFKALGEKYPTTEKGNPSFTEDALSTFTSPAAKAILEYRKASKRANTYFKNYLYFADKDDVIHADIKQSGTETGRFSYGDPNLQNVPKRGEDQKDFPIRKAFVPRDGFCFVMLDYDQMEYRLMVDYAEEKELSAKINSGLDVHTACMEMMGMTDREPAKTINFMNLYGGGIQKLADDLGIPLAKATELKANYWRVLPQVQTFIRKVVNMAERRGYIFNWYGRKCNFPDRGFSYIAPNHLIQGGGADVMKVAMNKIDDFLKPYKSRMLIQVHDELVFEISKDEFHIIPEIKKIMETVYPHRFVPLTVGVEHSFISWFDKVEGLPKT